jgi:hypothetical protein
MQHRADEPSMSSGSASDHRYVPFVLPDAVRALDESEQQERVEHLWRGDDLLQVAGLGGFVRALLAVSPTEGVAVTFGVWVALDAEDMSRATEVWWGPGYASFAAVGRLANAVPRHGLLDVPVQLAVKEASQLPYVVASTDPVAGELLTRKWPS